MSATLGTQLLQYFAGPTLSEISQTTSQIREAAATAQHTASAAASAASSISGLLDNPGYGLSGQPTIPRGDFTQKLCEFYREVFPQHHVLVVYDRCARLASFKGVLRADGKEVDGPTEAWTITKKIRRGKGKFGLWGFHVWVFREGAFELLGDGGYINWCFKSPKCERNGKKVKFFRIE